MKKFVHWAAILGLVGGSVIGPALTQQMSALALTETQVFEQLKQVPLFMLTNQEGQPLTYSAPNPANPADKTKQVQVYTFFVSQLDAQAALTSLKTSKPDLGKLAKVTPAALSGVLQFALEGKKQNSNVGVDIVPNRQQLDSAVTLLKQSGELVDKAGKLVTKAGQPFPGGTPLFYVADSKTGGPIAVEITSQQNGQKKTLRVVPFYFSNQDLQAELAQAKKTRPELATTTKVSVVMLDTLMSTMLSNNDPSISQFQLVPARDSIDYILKQQPGGAAGVKPVTPPAAPKKK
jgi:Tic22-like family